MEDSSDLKKDTTVDEPKNKFRYIPELIVGFGYILFFCLFFIFCFELIYTDRTQHILSQNSLPQNTFAVSLPPTTPTPHIPAIIDLKVPMIVEDDFTDNLNLWVSDQDGEKLKVRNGTLPLQSKKTNNNLIAYCQACPYLYLPYYIEADFSTDIATGESFGLVVNDTSDGFYLFEINMESKRYYLYQRGNDNWSLRASGESNKIQAFPNTNTLGIFANKDFLELYINATLVDLYTETSHLFYFDSFGFYVNNSGFELYVDNLSISKARK
jgi:hypothetical protein